MQRRSPTQHFPGVDSFHRIYVSVLSLMIGHTFLILLIPLLAALFYYSTPSSRRQPIFILNVLALALGLAMGIITVIIHIHAILSPQHMWPELLHIVIGFIGNFQMMLIDSILLVRLITVYPLNRVGRVRFMLLTFLPIILKVIRVVNTSIFIYKLTGILNGPDGIRRTQAAWHELPYQKLEWITQVVDNSYASTAFLWTIWHSRVQVDITSEDIMTTPCQSSTAQRIRTLFQLALSNFVIPTIISIVQLVLLFRMDTICPATLNNVALSNGMVSVFGVVFATVWAGKAHRREVKALPDPFPPIERDQRNADRLDEWPKAGLEAPPPLSAGSELSVTDHLSSTSDKDMHDRDDVLVDGATQDSGRLSYAV